LYDAWCLVVSRSRGRDCKVELVAPGDARSGGETKDSELEALSCDGQCDKYM